MAKERIVRYVLFSLVARVGKDFRLFRSFSERVMVMMGLLEEGDELLLSETDTPSLSSSA